MTYSCNKALQCELEEQFKQQLDELRTELLAEIPQDEEDGAAVKQFLTEDSIDDRLALFVVLFEATPKDLGTFCASADDEDDCGKTNQELVEELLANADLMKQMVLADGANKGKYGPAYKIYYKIQQAKQSCPAEDAEYPIDEAKREAPVLDRLALAIALEHAVPVVQVNPAEDPESIVDPVQRYVNYERAFLQGELDRDFVVLNTWALRFVVDGDEPDVTAAWGRKCARCFRPDHVINEKNCRYVNMVRTNVPYGSSRVKYDRPELQKYQNMLMNGGICGRRAFFGRFILRCFGIPTIARPSTGHGALAHWSIDKGWVVSLGPDWGKGRTKTKYHQDVDFLITAQARDFPEEFKQVKRAQFIGDLRGEKQVFGAHGRGPKELDVGYWYGLSLTTQKEIVDAKAPVHPIEYDDKASNYGPTLAEQLIAAKSSPDAKQITYQDDDNQILIPGAAFERSGKGAKQVVVHQSFNDDLQIYLKEFQPKGLTIMRGGTFSDNADSTCSGYRMLSGGHGKYNNWGFRVAIDAEDSLALVDGDGNYPVKLAIEIPDADASLEMIYIQPGTFTMGHVATEGGRFRCVEVPKHEIEITTGFYMGKYPVTQAQYKAIMGNNPSKSTKKPNHPADNIGEDDARRFCSEFTMSVGTSIRLPTEAEWEYSCRAGQGDTPWFFGDDASALGDYAWFDENSDGHTHPVGEKKPNPFGLYDVYGNVCERINDKYESTYFKHSSAQDPQGPPAGTSDPIDFKINVANGGQYELSVDVTTVNYNQEMTISVDNSPDTEQVIELPFTNGEWQCSDPKTFDLSEGEHTLTLWRGNPPQYGIAVKNFTLRLLS